MLSKEKTEALVNALVKLRGFASDEQAAEVPAAYPVWRSGVEYKANERILFNDILYKVLITHISQETWTPDVAPSLFAKVLIPDEDTIYPWEQPESTNLYMKGDKVLHNEKVWVSIVDNNSWEPGIYGWEEVIEEPKVEEPSEPEVEELPKEPEIEEPSNEIPEWVQPNGSNPYMKDDKVKFNDKIYISTVDNNVWSPNVYGWEEVAE